MLMKHSNDEPLYGCIWNFNEAMLWTKKKKKPIMLDRIQSLVPKEAAALTQCPKPLGYEHNSISYLIVFIFLDSTERWVEFAVVYYLQLKTLCV